MNEFYETVANFLEEIRCDSEERKYAVAPEDMKESVAEMKKMQKKFTQHLEKMPDADRDVLEEYIEVLEQAHGKMLFPPEVLLITGLELRFHFPEVLLPVPRQKYESEQFR